MKSAKKNGNKKEPYEYYLLKTYQVLEIAGTEKLIKKVKDDSSIIQICPFEEMFDAIHAAHTIVGHGGVAKTAKECQKKYDNIHVCFLNLFNQLCEGCLQKRTKNGNKKVVVKPIVSTGFMKRGQIDLINYSTWSFNGYNWILHYQDHTTKLSVLVPLFKKEAVEVANALIAHVFTLLGAPDILQSDNGREFVAEIVESLRKIWPTMTIVHGKPRHPQSQGSVERANGDVENMLSLWMRDNNSLNWPFGLKFVQMHKNNSNHTTIKCSPYYATFGEDMKFGLSSTPIPAEILAKLTSEEELEKVVFKTNFYIIKKNYIL